MNEHIHEDDLVLHYYRELEPAAEARAEAHLRDCGGCRTAYARLQRVLAVIDAAPVPPLPEHYERMVWARLEPRLAGGRGSGWLAWFVFSPARLAWAAAIAILVTSAFFAGRVSQREAEPPTIEASADLRERILMVDLGEHLDRSQMMLVELVSADTDTAMDMSDERERAEDLVMANRLYRQTASATGNSSVVALLDDLERMLVELAASPAQLSGDDMERIRTRIDADGLLFKVRVVSSALRERQKQEIRLRTGQSS